CRPTLEIVIGRDDANVLVPAPAPFRICIAWIAPPKPSETPLIVLPVPLKPIWSMTSPVLMSWFVVVPEPNTTIVPPDSPLVGIQPLQFNGSLQCTPSPPPVHV